MVAQLDEESLGFSLEKHAAVQMAVLASNSSGGPAANVVHLLIRIRIYALLSRPPARLNCPGNSGAAAYPEFNFPTPAASRADRVSTNGRQRSRLPAPPRPGGTYARSRPPAGRRRAAGGPASPQKKRKPAAISGGFRKTVKNGRRPGRASLLPRALLVAIRLQALSALVLVHLQTTFLFQIAHGG